MQPVAATSVSSRGRAAHRRGRPAASGRALTRALTERGHAVSSGARRHARAPAAGRRTLPTWWSSTSACPTSTASSCCGCCAPVSAVPVIVATARDDDRATVARPGRRGRRLRRQAVQRRPARRPDPGRAAACRPPAEAAVTDGRRRSPSTPTRTRACSTAGRWSCGPASSTCWPTSLPGPARSSPSASCSPRSGSSPYGGADKTVDVHLSWLRRKLGETAAEPRFLHTVRGVGVKLVAGDR